MSQTDTIVRSVPLNLDGTPRDHTLIPATSEEVKSRADSRSPGDRPAARLPGSPPATPAAPAAAPRARYIGSRLLFSKVDLEFPMELDGVEYHHLTIKPIGGAEFAQFSEMVAAGFAPNDAIMALSTGAPVELIRDLFLVDKLTVLETAAPFLPRQLRRALKIKTREEVEAEAAADDDQSQNESDTSTGTTT